MTRDAFNGSEILNEKALSRTFLEKLQGVKVVRFCPTGLLLENDTTTIKNASEKEPKLFEIVSKTKKMSCVFKNKTVIIDGFVDGKDLLFHTDTHEKVACVLKFRGVSQETIIEVLKSRLLN